MNACLGGFCCACRFKRLLFPSGRCDPCQLRGHHGVSSPSSCAFVPGALFTPPDVRALKPGTSKCISTPCDNTGQFGAPHRHLWHLLRHATSLANERGRLLARATVFVCVLAQICLSVSLFFSKEKLPEGIQVTTQDNKNILWKGANFFSDLVLLRRQNEIYFVYMFPCSVTQCINVLLRNVTPREESSRVSAWTGEFFSLTVI